MSGIVVLCSLYMPLAEFEELQFMQFNIAI